MAAVSPDLVCALFSIQISCVLMVRTEKTPMLSLGKREVPLQCGWRTVPEGDGPYRKVLLSFFRECGLKGEFYFGTKTQPPSFITWFSVAGGVLSSIGYLTRGQSKVTGPFVEVLSQELRNPIRQEGF